MKKQKYEDAELIDLYINQDLSSIKIAQILGVSVSFVCRHLRKFGLIKPPTGAYGRNGKKSTVYINGYPVLYIPDHPRAKSNGYVREHIIIAEQTLGRHLDTEEVVHHINGDKTDNRPENLMVFPNNAEHMRYHWALRKMGKENANKIEMKGE